MSSTGRKKDAIWSYFDIVKDNNKCKVIMAGLVLRMKKHIQKCVPSKNSQLPMSSIYDSESDEDLTLDKISKTQKHARDVYPDNNTGNFEF